MNFEGNPFGWGFEEQRSLTTLAKQGNATYNTPRETLETKTATENFFEQNIAVSPNPAFVTGFTAIDPMPFTATLGKSNTDSTEGNDCEDTESGD